MTATTSNTNSNRIFQINGEPFDRMVGRKVLVNVKDSGVYMKLLDISVAVKWVNPDMVYCSKRLVEILSK